MEKTRAELLHEAMEDWDALKHLYLVQTYYDYSEEIDSNACSWHQTGRDITLEDIMDDLISFYEDRDNEDFLCTDEASWCVLRHLNDDYHRHSLYETAEAIYEKYKEYEKENPEE